VRAGMISKDQQRSIDDDAGPGSSGVRLGKALVAKGWMTTPQVYEGLTLQAKEIFFSALALNKGTYFLASPLDMTLVPAMLRLDIEHLLLEGMRRLDEAAAAVPAPIQDEDLRRTIPVSVEHLPDDGAVRIISTYNDALASLFRAVAAEARASLIAEMKRFVADSVPYRELFGDAEVTSQGTLLAEKLLGNIAGIRGDGGQGSDGGITLLQVGLNELLFFVVFAAGDDLPPEVEQLLQRDVARALERLPKPPPKA